MQQNCSGQGSLDFTGLMHDSSGAMAGAMEAASDFLTDATAECLLDRVGSVVEQLPSAEFPDKRWFQKSYGREVTETPDDFLVGRGLFYLTEQRKLYLDCTGGHYQVTWGYQHPDLTALLYDGIRRGVVWDNHSNIPAAPVKRLSQKLIELANPGADLGALQADGERLNTVLLGTATGTVACAAAMKISLRHYERAKPNRGAPVFITLDGNYHGSDVFAQYLRGMWPQYFTNVECVMVQPNDDAELQQVFAQYGERVAGFWAEPIMMNREAIPIQPSYMQLARRLCDETGALLAIDEIQTGFWFPEVLMFHRLAIEPDLVVLGKGMTAGLHPLSALVYRGKYDLLEQYDAISTNGNAALAAYLALGCIELIQRQADEIHQIGEYYHARMSELAEQYPALLVEARGAGHMSGLKFHRVDDALAFHRAAIDEGLWLRVHAYHEGHSTILTKFALPFDRQVADWAIDRYVELLDGLQ
jgi:acetylornithine/succinyldiaminopimelate/putrescine aminotransferase